MELEIKELTQEAQYWTERAKELVEYKNNRTKEHLLNIISVSKIEVYPPNSASGVSFKIVFKNTSMKTIKYAFFEVVPYTRVGDIATCDVRDYSNYTGQVTGPVKPGAVNGRRSSWQNAWYNNTIDKIELVKINIEYMDGSTEVLLKDNIQHVIK